MYTVSQKSNCNTGEGIPSRVTPKFVPIARAATTANTLKSTTAQTQEDCYLKYLFLEVGAGLVNDLRIGNQSLNVSDSGIDTALFNNGTQRKPLIGIAVNGNIQMSIDVTTDADSAITGAFSCEAIDCAPSISEQGSAINKFFGLGSVSVGAGATAQLSAQALRNTTLKDLVLACHDEAEASKIDVTDITIKGRSLFSGQSGDVVSLTSLASGTQGFAVGINIPIETNERVVVSLKNNHGSALVVGGGLYCD